MDYSIPSEPLVPDLLLIGEPGGVEFKRGERLSKTTSRKILKAIIGMANREGGGYVLVGVDESDSGPELTGVDPSDLPSWTQDNLAEQLDRVASPRPEFRLWHENHDGSVIVVVRVAEFHETPVLCIKNSGDVLKRGALYCRPVGMAKTVEVDSEQDMRDILERATDRRVRRVIRQLSHAGLITSGTEATESSAFDEELGDF